jgi:hypothetical protein
VLAVRLAIGQRHMRGTGRIVLRSGARLLIFKYTVKVYGLHILFWDASSHVVPVVGDGSGREVGRVRVVAPLTSPI